MSRPGRGALPAPPRWDPRALLPGGRGAAGGAAVPPAPGPRGVPGRAPGSSGFGAGKVLPSGTGANAGRRPQTSELLRSGPGVTRTCFAFVTVEPIL